MNAAPRVIVTGADGFIGRHLLDELLGRGYCVRAVTRRPLAPHASLEVCVIDDICAAPWEPILRDAEAIVHLAAVAHRGSPRTEAQVLRMRAVNVDAVGALARAAATAGVRRMILLSSIGVLGATSGSGSFDARSPPAPHDLYARTKLDGERAAATAAAAVPELCVVRAPLVFGPKAPGNFGRLVASIQHGWPLPLGAIRNRRSLVSVWNLCDLLIACLTHPAAPGAPLLVADAPAVSTPELVRLCAEMLGVTARLWPVPVGVLRLAAAAAGREVDFMRLCGSLTVDDRDTRRRLGWAPPLDLRAGLRQSLRLGS